MKGGGFLPGAMAEANRWSSQFKVPLLSLTPIDTIRSLVLDPSQLQTVQKAKALVARADSAKDATVRQILTEWARVGQTRIINVDRVAGPPLSIELTNVPEAQALDTLLRTVSGYLAAPRPVTMPNASAYDRIFILPTSTGTPPRPTPIDCATLSASCFKRSSDSIADLESPVTKSASPPPSNFMKRWPSSSLIAPPERRRPI